MLQEIPNNAVFVVREPFSPAHSTETVQLHRCVIYWENQLLVSVKQGFPALGSRLKGALKASCIKGSWNPKKALPWDWLSVAKNWGCLLGFYSKVCHGEGSNQIKGFSIINEEGRQAKSFSIEMDSRRNCSTRGNCYLRTKLTFRTWHAYRQWSLLFLLSLKSKTSFHFRFHFKPKNIDTGIALT